MSDENITIEVDGVELPARRGQMLIEVTDAADIYVPRFCYHRKLSVAANCRMCLVQVEKAPKPLPACATPVTDGMKVSTRSAYAIEAQKATMEFLLINHPLDCPICDQGGECELQDLAMGFGRSVSRYTERKRVVRDKDIGPLVSTDMTRCIHCTRCVRFGQEIAGIQELGTLGRGEHMEIGTFVERSVDHELSGNIIDLCPVGALNNKPYRYRARSWEMVQHEGVSPHDSVGSNLFVHTAGGKVMRVVPRPNDDVNETWLSDRDRFSYAGLYSDDRLRRPMVRRDGEWVETDWDVALQAAARGLRKAVDAGGGPALGVLASPAATLEEHYLLQQIARGLGSDNVDHRLRTTDFRDQAADPPFPWLGRPIAGLEALDAAFVVGSDIRREAPILAHRLRKAAVGGGRVAFLNPPGFEYLFAVHAYLETELAALTRALAAVVKVAAESAGRDVPAPLQAAVAAAEAGEGERAVAGALAEGEEAAVLLGQLAMRHPRFSEVRSLAATLADLTGASLGYVPESNAAGASLAGTLPHRGPGAEALATAGLDASLMLRERLSAYLLFGVEPVADCAEGEAALAVLRDAGHVVVVSPYVDDHALGYADVMLPAGTFMETAGTFVNLEGRWQSFNGIASPVGEARPGWKVLRVLGNRLELPGFDYNTAEDVREALRALIGETRPDNTLAQPPAVQAGVDGSAPIRAVPMYGVDPMVRRSAPLQATREAQRPVASYP